MDTPSFNLYHFIHTSAISAIAPLPVYYILSRPFISLSWALHGCAFLGTLPMPTACSRLVARLPRGLYCHAWRCRHTILHIPARWEAVPAGTTTRTDYIHRGLTCDPSPTCSLLSLWDYIVQPLMGLLPGHSWVCLAHSLLPAYRTNSLLLSHLCGLHSTATSYVGLTMGLAFYAPFCPTPTVFLCMSMSQTIIPCFC